MRCEEIHAEIFIWFFHTRISEVVLVEGKRKRWRCLFCLVWLWLYVVLPKLGFTVCIFAFYSFNEDIIETYVSISIDSVYTYAEYRPQVFQ